MMSSRFARLVVNGALAISSQIRILTHGIPDAFDGQYTHPTPENGRAEWKFFQLTAAVPVADNPPASISVLFSQGYIIQNGPRDPTMPQYFLDVAGSFPNGSTFSFTVPAEYSMVTACGQEVTGTWGTVASFKSSPDLSTYTATFTAPQFGLEGTFHMKSRGKPHLMCNTTIDRTFSSAILAGTTLSAAERFVYNEFGWMTPVPGGNASANLIVQGSKLQFSGGGYHDSNYIPAPFNAAVESWYAGSGPLGPYDFTYISLVPLNSTKILTAGYLARDGVVLQNQCSVRGASTKDAVTVTPYGVVHDIGSGEDVPVGFFVEYTLANGEKIAFNLTSIHNAQMPDVVGAHRWLGRATGGVVGGKTYEGPFEYEWLSPALKPYVPPS